MDVTESQVEIPKGYYLTDLLSWSPDDRYLVVGATNYYSEILGLSNVLLVYDFQNDETKVLLELLGLDDIQDGISNNSLSLWSIDSSSIAIATTDGRIIVLDMLEGTDQTYRFEPTSLAWSPDGNFLAFVTFSEDDELSMKIIDLTSFKIIVNFPIENPHYNYVINWIE